MLIEKKVQNNFWYERNFNPWGANRGDCPIRAVSAGLLMKYEAVCRHLGVRFKNGVGLMRDGLMAKDQIEGSDLQREYLKPWVVMKQKVLLKQFCEVMFQRFPGRIFLVCLRGNPQAELRQCRHGAHITCVSTTGRHAFFIDTWDCSEMAISWWCEVKKQVQVGSEERIQLREFLRSDEERKKAQKEAEEEFKKLPKGKQAEEYLKRAFSNKDGKVNLDFSQEYADFAEGQDCQTEFDAAAAEETVRWLNANKLFGNKGKAEVQMGDLVVVDFDARLDLSRRQNFKALKERVFQKLIQMKISQKSVSISYVCWPDDNKVNKFFIEKAE